MSADKTAKNGPSLPVPPEEEEERQRRRQPQSGPVRHEEPRRSGRGSAADPVRRTGQRRLRRSSEFSDAVAVQIPSAVPTGARKPYFIFGDGQNSVDLWFFDLAPARSTAVHRQGQRRRRAERHRRSDWGRELRPGRVVGHLQTAAAPQRGRPRSRQGNSCPSPSRCGMGSRASAATGAASRCGIPSTPSRKRSRRPSARWFGLRCSFSSSNWS